MRRLSVKRSLSPLPLVPTTPSATTTVTSLPFLGIGAVSVRALSRLIGLVELLLLFLALNQGQRDLCLIHLQVLNSRYTFYVTQSLCGSNSIIMRL